VAAALAAAAGLALAHTHAFRFTADDAYISFRYAEHLVRYGVPIYNPPGVDPHPVEGYTNPGWVLLLALAHALGASTPAAAAFFGRASEVAALLGIAALAAALVPPRTPAARPVAAVGAAFVAAVLPEFAVWGSGGLEGPLAAALAWGAALAFERDHPARAGWLGALGTLVRPDAALVPAAYVLAKVAARPSLRTRHVLGRLARSFAGGALLLLAHLVVRRWIYGAWLPQTFAMKAGGVALAPTFGLAYLGAWVGGLGPVVLVAAVLGIVWARAVPLFAAVAAVVIYAGAVGGDFMAYGRLLLPATCGVAIAAGLGAGAVAGRLERAVAGRGVVWASVLGALALVPPVLSARRRHARDMAKPSGWLAGRFEGVHAMDRFARVRVAAGRALAARVPPDTRVVVGAAGALPWASDLPVWDAYGLVVPGAPALARTLPPDRARPGHQRVVPDAVLARFEPDLWCHVGYHGLRPPPASRVPRAYRRTHVFACVTLGRLEDPHDPRGRFDGGVYCCLRPRDRLADAFDTPP